MILLIMCYICFVKQKTAYDLRMSDWSSDVCSSDLAFGQAADIMVRLDRHRRPARKAHRLDHVRIERALRQEVRPADLLRFLLEHGNELAAEIGRASRRERVGHDV